MRLLHTERLELTEFFGEEIPRYAILSHTWGEGEILFGDVQQGRAGLLASGKAGLAKVLEAASVAKDHGYEYVWIDTCCIDKSSSSELSEAINSMFAWYRSADVCYAFISDYNSTGHEELSIANRWFTRGWTLQELIAPKVVKFYDRNWIEFGGRSELASLLSSITGIEEEVFAWHPSSDCPIRAEKRPLLATFPLTGRPFCTLCRADVVAVLDSFCVASRMSWAAGRSTTRVEDIAYCLLGVFGVNMPLLYGEGESAFRRLQHEIVRTSADQSIFAFTYPLPKLPRLGLPAAWWEGDAPPPALAPCLFAKSPNWFRRNTISPRSKQLFGPGDAMTLSAAGVELDLHVAPCVNLPEFWIAVLECSSSQDSLSSPAFLMRKLPDSTRITSFQRIIFYWPHDYTYYTSDNLWATAGSNEACVPAVPKESLLAENHLGEPPTVSFELLKLTRQTILLRETDRVPVLNLSPPVSRIRPLSSLNTGLTEVGHYMPFEPDLFNDASEPVNLSRDEGTVLCGAIGFNLGGLDEGFVISWGNTRFPFAQPKDQDWWEMDQARRSWYTEVHPWTRQALDQASCSLRDMSDWGSVRELLRWCDQKAASWTEASHLPRQRHGSSERTWRIAALGNNRIKVKATIEPVEFLGRQVMDIVVKVDLDDGVARRDVV